MHVVSVIRKHRLDKVKEKQVDKRTFLMDLHKMNNRLLLAFYKQRQCRDKGTKMGM